MKAKKIVKQPLHTLTLLAIIILLVGSRLYPPELELKRSTRSTRSRRTLLEVPVTFGKTHFIVGLAQEEVAPRKAEVVYTDGECSVNEAYFSPDDDLQQKLIHLIENEKKGIYLAVFSFTDKPIADALLRAKKRGVEVEIVVDPGFLHDRYTKVDMLRAKGVPIFVYDPKKSRNNRSTLSNIMHNKYAIFLDNIDGPKVWTGSFNFTKSARLSNQENVVVLNHPRIVNRYLDKFHELKKRTVRYNNIHASAGRGNKKWA